MRRLGSLGPLLAGLVLCTGVALWGWSAWREVKAQHRMGLHRYAEGLFAAAGLFQDPPGRHLPVPPDHFSGALQRMVESSTSLRFAVIYEGGRRVAWAGSASPALAPGSGEGERVAGRTLVLWRTLHPPARRLEGSAPLPGGPPPGAPPFPGPGGPGMAPPFPGPPQAGSPPPFPGPPQAGSPPPLAGRRPPPLVMLFGLDGAVPPAVRFQAQVDIGLRGGIVLLAGFALLLAWRQGLRRRRLATALAVSQREREHLEELSLAAAGLVHETKNPLGIIRGIAQRVAGDEAAPPADRERAARIVDEADRAGARLGDFLAFARLPEPVLAPVEARALLGRAAAVLADDYDEAGVALGVEAEDGWVLADEDQALQVLLNLLLNALEACPEEARVTLRFRREGGQGTLEVADTGRGVPPALLPEVWKPYVSGRPDGHGLGLAIVRRLVARHGWTVALESAEGQGTRVVIGGLRLVETGGDGPASGGDSGRAPTEAALPREPDAPSGPRPKA